MTVRTGDEFWARGPDGYWHWFPASGNVHDDVRAPGPKRRRHHAPQPHRGAKVCPLCWDAYDAATARPLTAPTEYVVSEHSDCYHRKSCRRLKDVGLTCMEVPGEYVAAQALRPCNVCRPEEVVLHA